MNLLVSARQFNVIQQWFAMGNCQTLSCESTDRFSLIVMDKGNKTCSLIIISPVGCSILHEVKYLNAVQGVEFIYAPVLTITSAMRYFKEVAGIEIKSYMPCTNYPACLSECSIDDIQLDGEVKSTRPKDNYNGTMTIPDFYKQYSEFL